MPRGFNPDEKIRLEQELIKKGTGLFKLYGLRKTSIDDIVGAVGIGKGSFYKFFPSKEALFFRCMELQEKELQEKYLTPLFTGISRPSEMFRKLFELVFSLPGEYPLITTMMNPDEYSALQRGLPREMIEEHLKKDHGEMTDFLTLWKLGGINVDEDPAAVNGLFRALIMVNLHREEIGEEIFPETVNLLSRILAAGMETLYGTEFKKELE